MIWYELHKNAGLFKGILKDPLNIRESWLEGQKSEKIENEEMMQKWEDKKILVLLYGIGWEGKK